MSNKNKLKKNQSKYPSVVHQSLTFSGPLPHPNILRGFDDVHPGAAKIIIEMAKEQSDHRHVLEKSVINSDIINSKLGLIFGFIIGMTGHNNR